MSMYTLTSIARRATSLGAAVAMLVAAVIPSVPAFADDLNPLTERSLTLSSSSPGWSDKDGSGNSTYAPPNSGANGKKSGNYFDFKVSSTATVNTMSFQYCTTSAGDCLVPGNNTQRGTDTPTTADLNITYPSATQVSGTDFPTVIDAASPNGAVKAVPGYTNNNPKYQSPGGNQTGSNGTGDPAEAAKNVAGNFIVMTKSGNTWSSSDDWTASAQKVATGSGTTNNYIVITNPTGVALTSGQQVKVLFFATDDNYITNPGAGSFFVKINTYNKAYKASSPGANEVTVAGLAPASNANVVDGGVTVANVMNQSIQITTKVLETMEFSVGTVDPNTLTTTELQATDLGGGASHTPCGRILTRMTPAAAQNVLQLGNQQAESSLETAKAYATHSYWRLSSNSSGGATVYYSGHTLSNTSGDEIKPIGVTANQSAPGSEQFGVALATKALSGTVAGSGATAPNFNTGLYGVNYAQDRATDKNWENATDNDKLGISSDVISGLQSTYTGTAPALWSPTDANWSYSNLNKSYHTSRLDPLVPMSNYANGSGRINGNDSLDKNGVAFGQPGYDSTNAQFAFDPLSDTIPRAIATESDQVVDCVTAKMRYVANIAATTPAGIYTTKVNYIAAPQY